ncbi:MAG: signal peptidase I [Candidatus Aenigmatarchaeota archaeon]
MNRKVNILTTGLLVILIIPFVLYLAPFVVGGNRSMIVLSSSMEPVLSPGDIIVTSGIEPEDLEKGDIITYKRGDNYITHKIIEVKNSDLRFKTKGIASEDPDSSLVNPSQVEGKMMLSIPFYGYIIHYLRGGIIPLLLILIPAVLLIFDQGKKIKRQMNGGLQ